MRARAIPAATAAAIVTLLCACTGRSSDATAIDIESPDLTCSIPTSQIFDGGPGKDGIPALVDPRLVAPENPSVSFLRDDDRVVGLEVAGQFLAMPLNIGWWHEIVNLQLNGLHLAITHCPLTGSSLVFDRIAAQNAAFGVSGLLYRNNLIMYDRNRAESFWPQMMRGARCGPRNGTALAMHPSVEMTWAGWRSLHPDTRVVEPPGPSTFGRDYRVYPYGGYDRVGNTQLLFPMDHVDERRPLKERVLGVHGRGRDFAYPYGALDRAGARAVTREPNDGRPFVVFWDRSRQAAAAFRPVAGGRALTFVATADAITDAETGSTWQVDGSATGGPLAGARLEPVTESYVAFWFAWAAFNRQTVLWTGDAG